MAVKELRSERLQALVTPKERAMLERVAARRGWTVSEYLRAASMVCAALDGEREALGNIGGAFVHGVVDAVTRRGQRLEQLAG